MIATQKCPTANQLQAFSLGQLSDSQSDELLDHVCGCQSCKAALETAQDAEDSLIAALRSPDEMAGFDAEPDCKVALAKALGALALAGDPALVGDEITAADGRQLPKNFGEYEIVRALGHGGMGSVFLARHTKLGREVALKLLAGHRLGDPWMRQRFEAEMQAVGRLSHPNIVAAHDARDVDGTAVLVTEFIDGLDLGQLVERTGPLGVADACEIIRQVAVALAYTSGQGFVHRDIKPSNIMLSKRGEVKLLDLGLARLQLGDSDPPGGMTGTGQTVGTADYVAPEQVTDSRTADARADIYSLGCTLFKLLSGTAPFAGQAHATAFAKMTAHVSKQPPSLAERAAGIPTGLVKLVSRMLAKDPAKRPQTPETIAEELAVYAKGCDLKQLAQRATVLQRSDAKAPRAAPASPSPQSRLKSLMRRSVPMPVAIAAALLGGLLGFAMGIIITITKTDGSKITLAVPGGSDIDVRDTPDTAPPVVAAGISADTDIDPLVFAILLEADAVDAESLQRAEQILESSNGELPVTTELGTWYPVTSDLSVPIEASHNDQRYTLARHHDDGTIGWEESRQHLSLQTGRGLDMRETTLEFGFGGPLSDRINALTRSNLRGHLAVIVNGRVVTAPRIMNEIRNRATITSNFTKEDVRILFGSLGGLLGDPIENTRPTDATAHAAADVGRHEDDADPGVALQGVWRQASARIGGAEIENVTTTIMAFDGDTYYVCSSQFIVGGGTFSVSREGQHHSIDFRDELNREEPLPAMRAIYRIGSDGRLEIHSDQATPSTRPTSFDIDDPSPTLAVLTLQRIGGLPRTLEEARSLTEGMNDEVSQAIMTLVRVIQVPPKALKPPTLEEMATANQQEITLNNLKKIGTAFHDFHSVFKKLPGSSNKREGSRRRTGGNEVQPFSWRVALLPYLGEDRLYEAYRFDEPWDSEHNRTLLAKMPDVYRSPFWEQLPDVRPVGETHYQGFVGEQTALGPDDGQSFVTFTDGTSPTLLVVESKDSVPWTKPQDLPFEKPEDTQRAKPFDGQPLHFLTADGAAHTMDPVDYEKLAKLITRDGGEPVKP